MKEAGQGRPWAQGGHPSKPGGRKEFLGKLNLQDRCGESWGAGGRCKQAEKSRGAGGWGAGQPVVGCLLPRQLHVSTRACGPHSAEEGAMVQRSQVPLPRSHSPEAELGCSPADRAGSGRQGSWSIQIRGGQICSLLWGAGGHRSCSPGSAKGGQDLLVSAWKGQRQGEKKEVLAEFVSSCYYSD